MNAQKCARRASSFVFRKFVPALFSCFAVIASTANAESASENFDLGVYKGKVVYLDFWASWCGPCKESFPYMQRIDKSFARDGLAIVTVNVDHAKPKAKAFLAQMHANLPVVYDPKGAIAKSFNVKDMPTSLLIDREGRVRFVHEGFRPEETAAYDTHILELLNEK